MSPHIHSDLSEEFSGGEGSTFSPGESYE